MAHLHKQAELGLRWLTCGARLFRRNPWLLGGMGGISAALLAALVSIPLIGAPLAGFVFPALAAAMLLALEATAGRAPDPPNGARALKAAPRAFVGALADESRLIQIVVLGLLAMAATLLAAMLAWQLAGTTWWSHADAGPLTYARAAVAALLALLVCSAAATALVYALPLALLQQEALLEAAKRSVRAAVRHLWALAVLEAVLLLPLVLGAAGSFASPGLAYLVATAAAALVLPLVCAALYCSYRTLFPPPAPRRTPAGAAPSRAGVRRA